MNTVYCSLRNFGDHLMSFTDDFKTRLKTAFDASGLTMRQLAKECEVSAPAVTRWLDKDSSVLPELKKIPSICRAINVSATYLVLGGEMISPPSPQVTKARELAQEVVDLLTIKLAASSKRGPLKNS